MLSVVSAVGFLPLALLAGSLVCWPTARAASRLVPGPPRVRPPRPERSRLARRLAVPASTVVGALAAGTGGACSATALAWLARTCWRARRRSRDRVEQSAALAGGLRLMVAELRAGAHPATAAEGAGRDCAPGVTDVFADIAATARLGGDVPALLEGSDRGTPELRVAVTRTARCWRLAEHHGVPLAGLLDAVRRDLESRSEFAGDVESKMAGPRSTAAVLSGLPVLGLLLGQAVGAGPFGVLAGSLTGQVLLVAGTGLICAGVLWTLRLTETAVAA